MEEDVTHPSFPLSLYSSSLTILLLHSLFSFALILNLVGNLFFSNASFSSLQLILYDIVF
jgi:hypothetical protein